MARFSISRIFKFNGLLKRSVFNLVSLPAADGFRIFRLQFVDETKNPGKLNALENSWLVIQSYIDVGHRLLTHAFTVQRVSQRLLLALCAVSLDLRLCMCDLSQAHVKAETTTQRHVFVRPFVLLPC